ncbi:hypothetical protein LCGC14_2831940, partial [marine sediment metagenome]
CYGEAEEGIMGGEMIDGTEHVDKKPEVVRPGEAKTWKSNGRNPYDKDPVGLAVDVFCALREKNPDEFVDKTMERAIATVKQAREAFE